MADEEKDRPKTSESQPASSGTLSSKQLLQRSNIAQKRITAHYKSIQGVHAAAKAAKNDASLFTVFRGKYKMLPDLHKRFLEEWDALYEMYVMQDKEKEFPVDEKYLALVDSFICECNGFYEDSVHPITAPVNPAAHLQTPYSNESLLNHSTATMARNRLPKISIPTFEGDILEWVRFRDIYCSLVHEEPYLSEVEKFHHLLGALKGEPKRMVSTFNISEAHYQDAWQTLKDRYDNKRILASGYLRRVKEFMPSPQLATNPEYLREYLKVVVDSLTSLRSLNIPNEADYIKLQLALDCLDSTNRQLFEEKQQQHEFPTYTSLVEFIQGRCQILELSEPVRYARSPTSYQESRKDQSKLKPKVLTTFKQTQPDQPQNSSWACYKCNKPHAIYHCKDFFKLSPATRRSFVQSNQLCTNCLKKGHNLNECPSSYTCRQCQRKHHTLLHDGDDSEAGTSNTMQTLHTSQGTNQEVLLGTAQARIRDRFGKYHLVRLIIDCGSQRSFITSRLATQLQLTDEPNLHRMCGFGDSPISGGERQAKCELVPINGNVPRLTTKAVIVTKISEQMPSSTLPSKIRSRLDQGGLADVDYWRPGPIDFLLGADLFPKILSGSPRSKGEGPTLLSTVFGSVIMGPIGDTDTNTSMALMTVTTEQSEMHNVMERFWAIEEVNTTPEEEPTHRESEAHFTSTHTRNETGRYILRLPFKDSPPQFPDSRINALRRFHSLEAKLRKNRTLKEAYETVLLEQINQGYITPSVEGAYFLPHHGVMKDSTTTKLRIVFDASAQTTSGSLNERLRTGPKLQTEIKDVLLGFRMHPFVFSADICQMYLQIIIHPDDRKFQHFFYRFDSSKEVQEYELQRLTFGLNCSPYLALRVIKQLLIDEGATFPRAVQALSKDIYIDDVLTGAETLDEALALQNELISLLSKGGFELRKWSSNARPLLKNVTDERTGTVSLSDIEDASIKILGLQWDPMNDVLSYRIQARSLTPTKRGVMSTIARIYDPLGYLAPVVFKAKIFMQGLWKQKLEWDEPLPPILQEQWEQFYNELPELKTFMVPRYLFKSNLKQVTVIGFADASSVGYAAVIYLRTESGDGEIECHLIFAKTKLAPLKPITIPRLELCAALLLVRCLTSLRPLLDRCQVQDTFLLSDSTTVLSWINTPASRLKTFVANRIASIQELSSPMAWYHVPTHHNVADVASRGVTPKQFLKSCSWWRGPSWMKQASVIWPIKPIAPSEYPVDGPEAKPEITLLSVTSSSSIIQDLINRISTLPKLVRVMAYVKRFIRNARKPITRCDGVLQLGELNDSTLALIKDTQMRHFAQGTNTKCLKALAPFLDQHGVLRVGGRLAHAPISQDTRQPILLPSGERLVELLLDHLHRIHLHAGPQLLQAIVRQRYWVISARRLIRSRVHQCLRCHQLRGQGYTPYMSDLPPSRYEQGRAFINVGTDFAGPFFIKESERRKAALGKAYICVFVCFGTKAVHIEVVSKLSTAAFLACFDRFIARRGLPARVFSDNGTNFTGASNEIRQLQSWWNDQQTKEAIQEHTSARGIKWDHIPPQAPHFGGLWEAAVKSCKHHLLRVVGVQILTFEELCTLTSRIEALLNSRPLYPLSSTPDSYEVLTPGHFLIGAPLTARHEEDILDIQINRLNRWQLLQRFTQTIWKKWRFDYLNQLQQRSKWTSNQPSVDLGTLVLVKNNNVPPLEWIRGRVIELLPGQDGITRVVRIKTPQGTYTRALTTLAPLLPAPIPPETTKMPEV